MDVANGTLVVSVAKVFQCLSQVADILQNIHSRGLVHNDVKPANITIEVDKDNKVKVTLVDLGLMTAVGERSAEGVSPSDYRRIEKRRRLYCTHMAPEFCYGLPVDTSSDVFSLGVTMFYMMRKLDVTSAALQEVIQGATAELP